MKKKTKEIQEQKNDSQTLAESLRRVEHDIETLEAAKEALRVSLFKNLKEQGVKAVRLENGDQYIRAERAKLVIKNQRKAMQWALENPEARMKLDTSAALLARRQAGDELDGAFNVEHTEYLTIRRARPTPDETNPAVDVG